MEALPFLSSFTTLLLSFCASRMPPSFVAMIPSALLPSTSQISFHFCPAATTPGISVTVYSLGLGSAAAPGRGPGGRPVGAGGGTLHVFNTSGSFESRGACTPGPVVFPAGGGGWHNPIIAPRPPNTTANIPIDFIQPPFSASQNIKIRRLRPNLALKIRLLH